MTEAQAREPARCSRCGEIKAVNAKPMCQPCAGAVYQMRRLRSARTPSSHWIEDDE